jgi:uncharacterized glyoxalase superfamily protein PhnB
MAKHIPEGFHTLTTYLVVPDGDKELQFLAEVLGATLLERHNREDGTVKHATVRVGDSPLMMSQATAEYAAGTVMFYAYVEDVDAVYQRAMAAGATSLAAPAEMYYGDRSGAFLDPAGNKWYVATHKEDVTPEEIERRSKAPAAK